MSFKTVAFTVAMAVVVLTAVDAFIVYQLRDAARFAGHTGIRAFALGAAGLAAAMVAGKFSWFNEYVGRAWTLLSLLYLLLAVSYLLDRLKLAESGVTQTMVIVGNLAAVGAFWMFGYVLKNAGLEFYGSRLLKLAVFAGAVVIACVLVLPTVVQVLRSQLGGADFVAELVSAATDMLTFILIAPLLLTVWSFRGGKLSWVYGFVALSTVGWMINQAANDVLPQLLVRDTQMLGLFLACASVVAGAYVQQMPTQMEASSA